MYLKKLEMQGFKSFADKTKIEFKDDITAIVGPNGSGKSNISDAIRWVLGEQSVKSLRGDKMEDVIFSGTDKRRALGYSEVTITFDNTGQMLPIAYNEVAVTRRMFRSGESEYYINKNSCRLKDIRGLFMDSGIGKDGYSIIGQGRIDEILSNKPEDRRNLFEEAAGITKYKSKKEESERKLDKTDNNLTRVDDLIYEVLSQKNSLKNDAEKAENFKRYYSRLRDLEVNLFIRNILKIEKQIDGIRFEQEKIKGNLDLLKEEKNTIETSYNKNKLDIEQIEAEVERNRTIKFDTIQTYEKNKNQISIFDEKENYLKKDLDRLEKEKVDLKVQLQELEDSKIQMNKELAEVSIKFNNLQTEYNFKCTELNDLDKKIRDFELELDRLKSITHDYYDLSSEKKNQISSINTFKANIGKRADDLELQIIENNKKKDSIDEDINNLKNKKSSIENSLEEEKKSLEFSYSKKAEINNKYKQIEESIKNNQIKLNGLNSNLNLYKSMEAGYEGYYKSVRGLLKGVSKNKELQEGMVGVVADLIKVDPKYEIAIDISLGSSIQNIVVETEGDAKKLVNYLKEERLGRATFLPLDTIKGRKVNLNPKDLEEFNILGLAHELIEFDSRYNNIFEFLLGRTIIVYDMDAAIKLANKYRHMYRIVTLDGEVFNTGGSITGGSSGKNTMNIISRKNKINNLTKEINMINNELLKLEDKKQKVLNNLSRIDEEIKSRESNVKSLDLTLLECNNTQANLNNELNRINDEILNKRFQIGNLSKEQANYKTNKENLEKELIDIKLKLENSNKEIEEIRNSISKLKNQRNYLSEKTTDMKIELNKTDSLKESLESRAENYNNNKTQTNNNILVNNKSINDIKENLEALNSDRRKISIEIEKHESSEDDISVKLNELIKKKEVLSNKFHDEQDRLKILNDKILQYEKQLNDYKVKLTKYEMQVENYSNRLMDGYELTLEEAMKFEIALKDLQQVQAEVNELKNNIKKLGNINISAIDDYKDISERYEFLTKQRNDLTKAKEDLNEIIKDMEKKIKSQFIASFEVINDNFTEIFSILFNGGKAKLELEDDENILSSGVEIKIQPPGKKLQNLSLLSGGEKSLTAVALLFAILKTKPSPFCILDEIDAALDEANITRYTNYLKSLTDTTQFILITHRKTTMEIADVLYGVTMEEEGVSKLVSVKLKDNLIEAS